MTLDEAKALLSETLERARRAEFDRDENKRSADFYDKQMREEWVKHAATKKTVERLGAALAELMRDAGPLNQKPADHTD